MRVAVVDIGTNSTRLLIADVEPGGGVTECHRESIVTRLGEGVDATGRLGDAPQARVFAALERYAAEIAAYECEASAAVMTSAVRDAANGAAFVAAVHERFGLEGRTLSGDEEAAFTYAGATAARPPDDPTERVVIDIGGGSTELVCGARGELEFHVSTQIGVVRHTERHLHSDPPTASELAALAADVDAGIAAAVPADVRARVEAAIAVAGTATSCAAIDLALDPYDTAKVEGHVLSHAKLEALLERLAAIPLAERRRVTGLDPDRAPTIVAGVVVLTRALVAFGLDEVEVSDRDLLWGVAIELATKDRSIG
ncbi:MAG TPA: Ppx/GppA family phosphatase [Solirubrobacteraceae bacterium]|nr:Ppx/GppA family phosphatase [Solirubrobacteraceae bacterium]